MKKCRPCEERAIAASLGIMPAPMAPPMETGKIEPPSVTGAAAIPAIY